MNGRFGNFGAGLACCREVNEFIDHSSLLKSRKFTYHFFQVLDMEREMDHSLHEPHAEEGRVGHRAAPCPCDVRVRVHR